VFGLPVLAFGVDGDGLVPRPAPLRAPDFRDPVPARPDALAGRPLAGTLSPDSAVAEPPLPLPALARDRRAALAPATVALPALEGRAREAKLRPRLLASSVTCLVAFSSASSAVRTRSCSWAAARVVSSRCWSS